MPKPGGTVMAAEGCSAGGQVQVGEDVGEDAVHAEEGGRGQGATFPEGRRDHPLPGAWLIPPFQKMGNRRIVACCRLCLIIAPQGGGDLDPGMRFVDPRLSHLVACQSALSCPKLQVLENDTFFRLFGIFCGGCTFIRAVTSVAEECIIHQGTLIWGVIILPEFSSFHRKGENGVMPLAPLPDFYFSQKQLDWAFQNVTK